MTKVEYVGPDREREVVVPVGQTVVCKRNKVVDLPELIATELLDIEPDSWELAGRRKKEARAAS